MCWHACVKHLPNAQVKQGAGTLGVFEEDWSQGSTAVVLAYSAAHITMPGLALRCFIFVPDLRLYSLEWCLWIGVDGNADCTEE